jgi:glutaconyl-CoA/methylmalonyl-CoA decarboxylase subunit gamma
MKKLRITVDGKTYDVAVEVLEEAQPAAAPKDAPVRSAAVSAPRAAPPPPRPAAPSTGGGADTITSPLAGKVVSIDVVVGDAVKAGEQVATIEAMKMNTFIYAEIDGTVSAVVANPGDMVEESGPLIKLG